MSVGFIGLGHLGSAMVRRLFGEGVDVVAWNRTPENVVNGLGIKLVRSPQDVAEQVDIIFLNLFDSNAVEEIMHKDGGLLAGVLENKIIIDTTTNHFEKVLDFYTEVNNHFGTYLEAPVLGSVVPAEKGELTILVSGDRMAHEMALPYFNILGKSIVYLGTPGLATKLKLINNVVLGSFMATLAEALVLGEEAGLEKQAVLDILGMGAGNSTILNAKRQKLLKEDFSTQFSSELIYKDLHYAQDLARSLERPLFTGSIAKELFAMTFKKGLASEDLSAIYEVLKGL